MRPKTNHTSFDQMRSNWRIQTKNLLARTQTVESSVKIYVLYELKMKTKKNENENEKRRSRKSNNE